jgi:hypothetical protein
VHNGNLTKASSIEESLLGFLNDDGEHCRGWLRRLQKMFQDMLLFFHGMNNGKMAQCLLGSGAEDRREVP